jgi:hypothetical protein
MSKNTILFAIIGIVAIIGMYFIVQMGSEDQYYVEEYFGEEEIQNETSNQITGQAISFNDGSQLDFEIKGKSLDVPSKVKAKTTSKSFYTKYVRTPATRLTKLKPSGTASSFASRFSRTAKPTVSSTLKSNLNKYSKPTVSKNSLSTSKVKEITSKVQSKTSTYKDNILRQKITNQLKADIAKGGDPQLLNVKTLKDMNAKATVEAKSKVQSEIKNELKIEAVKQEIVDKFKDDIAKISDPTKLSAAEVKKLELQALIQAGKLVKGDSLSDGNEIVPIKGKDFSCPEGNIFDGIECVLSQDLIDEALLSGLTANAGAGLITTVTDVKIAPNPSNGQTIIYNLPTDNSGRGTWSVYNLAGGLIRTQDFTNGDGIQAIELYGLANGAYIIVAQGGGLAFSSKIFIQDNADSSTNPSGAPTWDSLHSNDFVPYAECKGDLSYIYTSSEDEYIQDCGDVGCDDETGECRSSSVGSQSVSPQAIVRDDGEPGDTYGNFNSLMLNSCEEPKFHCRGGVFLGIHPERIYITCPGKLFQKIVYTYDCPEPIECIYHNNVAQCGIYDHSFLEEQEDTIPEKPIIGDDPEPVQEDEYVEYVGNYATDLLYGPPGKQFACKGNKPYEYNKNLDQWSPAGDLGRDCLDDAPCDRTTGKCFNKGSAGSLSCVTEKLTTFTSFYMTAHICTEEYEVNGKKVTQEFRDDCPNEKKRTYSCDTITKKCISQVDKCEDHIGEGGYCDDGVCKNVNSLKDNEPCSLGTECQSGICLSDTDSDDDGYYAIGAGKCFPSGTKDDCKEGDDDYDPDETGWCDGNDHDCDGVDDETPCYIGETKVDCPSTGLLAGKCPPPDTVGPPGGFNPLNSVIGSTEGSQEASYAGHEVKTYEKVVKFGKFLITNEYNNGVYAGRTIKRCSGNICDGIPSSSVLS